MRRGIRLLLAGVILLSLVGDGALAPSSAPESWIARAKRDLAALEYHASVAQRGLQAPNRAHGLRTVFEPSGIRLYDRLKVDANALLGVTLTGVGRGTALAPAADGVVSHEGARVEIRRDGLVEWYVNAPNGLEQGFTFAKPVEGEGELVLELAFDGAHAARLNGGGVELETSVGRGLRYDRLLAEDARGRELPARIELASADRIKLVVDDRGAEYPVVVDPLFTSTFDARVTADQIDSLFGAYAAAAGDVNRDGYADVIVGAHLYDAGDADEGAVFIFHGGPSGLPTGGIDLASTMLQSDQPGAKLGEKLASAGDVNGDGYSDVIVGASDYVPVANPGTPGAAFIFHGGPSGIASGALSTATTTLDARPVSGTVSAYRFGRSVASAGDVNGDGYDDVLVSATSALAPPPIGTEGVVFVYLGSASGVASGGQSIAAAKLTGGASWAVGQDIAGACDVNADGFDDLIIGAPLRSYPGALDVGFATVHHGSSTGIASGQVDLVAATLLSGTGVEYDQFGYGVGCAGDLNGDAYDDAFVVALGRIVNLADSSTGYVYFGGASGIPSGAPSTANKTLVGVADYGFVTQVAAAGDVNGDGYADLVATFDDDARARVLLGASNPFPAGFSGSPSVSVEVGGITYSPSPAGVGDVNGDGFDDVLLGAPHDQTHAAYLFLGSALPTPSVALDNLKNRMAFDFDAGALSGFSVASAGDVNGDGYDDRIVGAPNLDLGLPNEGGAWIFLGSPTPNAVDTYLTSFGLLRSGVSGSQFGSSVASAGDVNGDGYADVIVGAPTWSLLEYYEGAAFVFHGSPSGFFDGSALQAPGRIESNLDSAMLGRFVGSAGDVNGDGYADVIVSRGVAFSPTSGGAALVFHGGPVGIGERIFETASARIETGQPDASVYVVGPAGDVNGDGFGDVIASSTSYSGPELAEGGVFVFHGSPSGIGDRTFATANTKLESNEAFSQFGRAAAAAGDVNGDGFGDVITGWSNRSAPFANVFLGGPTGIPDATPGAAHRIDSVLAPGASTFFSDSVAGVGDMNGDGFGDLVVGDWGSVSNNGAAFLVNGNALANFPGPYPQISMYGPGAQLGKSVAAGGDANGDGYADVLVGAPYFDEASTDQGAAHLFFGNGQGRPATRRQFAQNSAATVVAPGGTTETLNSVRIEFAANHPGGKGRVRSEMQMCAVGTAFGAPGCLTQLSPWLVVTASLPTRFVFWNFTGLTADTRYRWRARVQYAEDSGPLPVVADHGPWKRPLTPLAGFDVRTARDSDGDGIVDMADNCPYVSNPGQEDDGSFGDPEGIGNACQCGHVAGSGHIDSVDIAAYRAALANPSGAGLSAAAQTRCVVYRAPAPCSVMQVSVLRRALDSPSLYPITSTPPAQVCPAAQPPS